MAYKKTETKADFSKLEHETLEFWRSDDTFHKSLNKTKQGHPFSFYDGPPFGNGLPHWGHLGVSAVKDMVLSWIVTFPGCIMLAYIVTFVLVKIYS